MDLIDRSMKPGSSQVQTSSKVVGVYILYLGVTCMTSQM